MNLTRRTQQFLGANLSVEDALPTQMPVYVNSLAYLFGAAALSALGMLILTGMVLCIFGPGWYHVSQVGHFFNSLHFWSVQVFFGLILLHEFSRNYYCGRRQRVRGACCQRWLRACAFSRGRGGTHSRAGGTLSILAVTALGITNVVMPYIYP